MIRLIRPVRSDPSKLAHPFEVHAAPLTAFGARHYECLAGPRATVLVVHPQREPTACERTGYLAFRRLGDLKPGDLAALRD